ncbi:MAG TPA: hypothetical protein VNY51_09910 [Candidatus Dormibacteraeota bacterium]|nr:hypothetical protein [Candidatus Dormibacteraeota bacterium]
MSINNKLIVIFAGLTTIATVVYSVFAGWQLYEIHSGAKDTHDLAVAAGKQADKMKDMSDAADKIRQAAEGMVTQEQRVADNAKNALDASNRQSKAVLDAGIANSRLDQRPWVSVSEFALSSEPDTQQPFSEDVLLQNTGKTPALDELCQAQPLIWRLQPPKYTDHDRIQ